MINDLFSTIVTALAH